MQWRSLLFALCASLAAWAEGAHATGLPPAYAAIVVQATGQPGRHEFDLSAALARARREHKRLYVYLGASDCPYCHKYEAFLSANVDALRPHFAPYLMIDLRSALSVTVSSPSLMPFALNCLGRRYCLAMCTFSSSV